MDRDFDGASDPEGVPGRSVQLPSTVFADRVMILRTKEKASESWAHNPYIETVARWALMPDLRRNAPSLEKAKSEEKPMWNAARIAAFLRDRDKRGLPFDDIHPDGPGRLVRGGLVEASRQQSPSRPFGPRSRPNRRPAWEKFQRNPFIMAIAH